jgi:hypothetical protein
MKIESGPAAALLILSVLPAAASLASAHSQPPAPNAAAAPAESSRVRVGLAMDDARLILQPEDPPKDGVPESQAAEEVNTGQDPTKPLARLDIRLKYQDLPGGNSAVVPTLRLDVPFALGNGGWKLGTRFDLPFAINDVPSPDNPDGDWHAGTSDALAQFLFITPPQGRWQFAFGTQVLFPTGSEDQMGTGKWQLAPTVAGIYALPEISKGSFAGLLVKDQFSVAGDEDRRDIHDLVIQPLFNINLPDAWFLTLAPEIRVNLEDDGDAFVPFNVQVGKMISPKSVMSLEFKAPLVDDYKQYDFEVEFRVGFFF